MQPAYDANGGSRQLGTWRDPSLLLLVLLSVAVESGGAALGVQLLLARHHAVYCTIFRTVGYVIPSCWR